MIMKSLDWRNKDKNRNRNCGKQNFLALLHSKQVHEEASSLVIDESFLFGHKRVSVPGLE